MNVTALNLSASENEQPTVGKMGQTVKAQDSWAAITGKIAGGDRDSFASYYEAFFDVMYATVKRSTGCDESTCLDIVQDAMLKAVRKMKALDSHEHTLAWTRAVAKTTAYDFLRKRQRQNKVSTTLDGVEADAPNVEQEIDALARLAWVEEQLKELPGELGSMIGLKYRMGWTLREIGEKFGLKTGAVDGKIRRAMDDLKQKAVREFEIE